MFCTREAFHATGGFNERFYWGEEGGFALALKRQGRFVVLRQYVITSGRRFRKTSALQLLVGGIRMIFSPVKIWDFIPRSWTPWDSPLGKFRFFISIFLCHVGLVLWPCAVVLFVNLLRQKRWTGLVQSVALIAFCVWQAWGATHGVIWIWTHLFHWLV